MNKHHAKVIRSSIFSFFPNVPDISCRKCAFIREMNWHCATDRLNSLPVFQLCSRQFHFHVLITHTNKQLNRNFNWAACIWCLPPLLCISDVNECSKHKLHIRTVAFPPPPLTPRCPKRDASIANWAASGKANSRFFFNYYYLFVYIFIRTRYIESIQWQKHLQRH